MADGAIATEGLLSVGSIDMVGWFDSLGSKDGVLEGAFDTVGSRDGLMDGFVDTVGKIASGDKVIPISAPSALSTSLSTTVSKTWLLLPSCGKRDP